MENIPLRLKGLTEIFKDECLIKVDIHSLKTILFAQASETGFGILPKNLSQPEDIWKVLEWQKALGFLSFRWTAKLLLQRRPA